jgi:hypothetical protein
MELSSGKKFGTLPNWKHTNLSKQIEFNEKIICSLNKNIFYVYLKEQEVGMCKKRKLIFPFTILLYYYYYYNYYLFLNK